jgi:N-acetylglucosamine-6-phosphate deacetylase
MKKVVFADKFFLPGAVEGPGYLEIENGKFAAFGKECPQNTEIINRGGLWVAPGLVDTHIHGIAGFDVMDNDLHGLKTISQSLLSCGVTSYLPTTLTASAANLNDVVKTIGDNYKNIPGARIEGIFLEGPFFSEKYKGAQNPAYFSAPSVDMLAAWQRLSGGLIRKIAIAPELEGAVEFTKYAAAHNIKVALAHSGATYEQAKTAVDAGASVFAHTYNGMSPLNHREPGMVGAAMTLKNVYAEIICDGHHVSPVAVKILMDVRGRGNTVLVTDCMRAGLMPEGKFSLGDFEVTVKDGAAKLANGSLAGSILQLKNAVKNVFDWQIATAGQAIDMATAAAAKSAGIDNTCGSILPGRNADFIALTPKLELIATYLGGELAYEVK